MLKQHSKLVSRLVLLTDLGLTVIAFIAAYYTRDLLGSFTSLGRIGPFSKYQSMLYIAILICFLVFRYCNFYAPQRTRTLGYIFWMVFKGVFVSVIIFAAFIFFIKAKYFPRTLYLLFFLFNLMFITFEKWTIRLSQSYLRERGYNFRNCVLVGDDEKLKTLIELMDRHQEWGIRIEGVITTHSEKKEKEIYGQTVLGNWNRLPEILSEHVIDEVVFAIPPEFLNELKKHVWECEEQGINARVLADFITPSMAQTRVENLNGVPLITYSTTPHNATMLCAKRCLDIVGSSLGLVLLSPAFLVISAAIKLSSPGTVFYTQDRVGKNGRIFKFYKFRSMYRNADTIKKELEKLNEMSGPVFKMKDDPRITEVGKFLRKWSLDETPQFWNIFKGEMSLVGPRPPLPEEVKQYDSWQRRRLSMKPGLTCIWQVEGRNRIDFEEWMKLDLKYIDTWSLWLDLRILMKTVPAVLSGKGAS